MRTPWPWTSFFLLVSATVGAQVMEVTIDFDCLQNGEVVTDQYPVATFSSDPGNEVRAVETHTAWTLPNLIGAAYVGGGFSYGKIVVDFDPPADDLGLVWTAAGNTVFGKIDVYVGGVLVDSLIVAGGFTDWGVEVDLSPYPGVSRLELGGGYLWANTWDHFTFTVPAGPPVASFTWEPVTPLAGEEVHFTNLSTGPVETWLWEFGDGTSSTQRHPVHTYAAPGQYDVYLTVTNPLGSDFLPVVITVAEPAVLPEAAFTFEPGNPYQGEEVHFTDLSTGAPTTWSWGFGDGATSAEQNPNHTYAGAGTYPVSLSVSNAQGSDTATTEVVVSEPVPPPEAAFTFVPQSPYVGEAVQFTDQSTGEPAAWFWTFGDGATSTERHPVHAYAGAGSYPVSLAVSNTGGSDVASTSITVQEALAPQAAFTFAPQAPVVAETVQFADQSTGEPTAWSWSFGDGASSGEQSPSHAYMAAGTYSVSLTVSNAAGSDTSTEDIVVSEPPAVEATYFLPAAANGYGAGGSHWVTQVEVTNTGVEPMTWRLLWLPRDQANPEPLESSGFTLGAGMSVHYENVLAEVLGLDEVFGALALVASSDDALLMSRTLALGADGTFGQAMPGFQQSQLIPAGRRARIVFMAENEQYRSNVGLLNATAEPVEILLERVTADGVAAGIFTVRLGPYGNTQLNRLFQDLAPVEAARVEVWTETEGAAFLCYGSLVDNTSSDPTTVLPQ